MGSGDNVVRALAAAVDEGIPVALATVVETRRSVPRHTGTKMLVYPDGTTIGTVGGGAMESAVIDEAAEALRAGAARLLEYDLLNPAQGDPGICGGTVRIYLEPYMPPHTVYVVGCGHVGKAVVDLAHWLGYRTIAVDDRPELTTDEALPNADVRFTGSVAEAIAAHPVPEDASIVLVTRSTDLDAEALPLLLGGPARYIGVMGSKTRWRATRRRLIDQGVSGDLIDSVYSPIGLDVHAETLEEIAVSIMSQVIRVNRSAASS